MDSIIQSLAFPPFEGKRAWLTRLFRQCFGAVAVCASAKQEISSPANRILMTLAVFIVVGVVVTTSTHHLRPELTGVPAHSVGIFDLVVGDALMAIMGMLAFWHAHRMMGARKAATFFVSCWLFAGIEETAWILSGRFGLVAPTYYFPYGGLWFFEIPVYTCLAWFLICYCGYAMVKQLFAHMRPAGVAAMVAGFGTCWDLWLDPAVCNRHLVSPLPDLWVWLSPSGVRLFDIPLLNFAGWFGVIFTIIFVFDKVLRPVEQVTLRIEKTYYQWLAMGWGVLFLALHVVGAMQYLSTANLFPVHFGTPVDPVAAGTATIAAVIQSAYFVLLVAGCAVVVTHLRKRQVDQALSILPALLVGWWLNAGLDIALRILVVYPGSSLLWLLAICSIFPASIVINTLPLSRVRQTILQPLNPLTWYQGPRGLNKTRIHV